MRSATLQHLRQPFDEVEWFGWIFDKLVVWQREFKRDRVRRAFALRRRMHFDDKCVVDALAVRVGGAQLEFVRGGYERNADHTSVLLKRQPVRNYFWRVGRFDRLERQLQVVGVAVLRIGERVGGNLDRTELSLEAVVLRQFGALLRLLVRRLACAHWSAC